MTTTPTSIGGLVLWLDAIMQQMRRSLHAIQDAADQAVREQGQCRYDDALASLSRAAALLRDEVYPHLATWIKRETDPTVQQRLAAWVDILNDLFEGEAACG